ncbi:MAG: hypothetical protein DI527_08815 [Chelatococcus sp.]|nr:MAG: hypothetical protein DI527_08815 [Chelatococcus sp.]
MPDLSRRATLRTAETRVLRLRLLRLRDEVALIRRDRLLRKYNPDQPRVPAGNSGGGRWTSGSGGGGSSGVSDPTLPGFGGEGAEPGLDMDGSEWASLGEGLSEDGAVFEQAVVNSDGATIHSEYAASRAADFDERQTVTPTSGERISFETTDHVQTIAFDGPDGGVVSRTLWTPGGPEPDATIQPAFAPMVVAPAVIAGGLLLYDWYSRQEGIGGLQAVMGFNAREYSVTPLEAGKLDLSYVGRLSEEQAELACRRLPEVRSLTDRAAEAAGAPELYPSRAVYGTAVHTRFKRFVDELKQLNFVAERSFLKEAADPTSRRDIAYGHPSSIRTDAYEYRDDGTLCVYDLKTGRAGLGDRRAEILANAAKHGFDFVRRIIVMDIRPRS